MPQMVTTSIQFPAGILLGILISPFWIYLYLDDKFPMTTAPVNQYLGPNEVVNTVQRIRLLCWILSFPSTHLKKAIHVNRTWGRRCDKLLFMSSETNTFLDTVALPNVKEGRRNLYGKSKEALKYIWANHRNEYDWILKADVDTYVIVENLKHLLAGYSTSDPIMLGLHRKKVDGSEWADGGAGYVLSQKSLEIFIEEALPNTNICRDANVGPEDMHISRCLLRSGVKIVDPIDPYGKHRFMFSSPSNLTFPKSLPPNELEDLQWTSLVHPLNQGMDCCANDAVSFHHIKPAGMYALEYMVYHLRVNRLDECKYVQYYPLEFK